jgi:hypothetical protein
MIHPWSKIFNSDGAERYRSIRERAGARAARTP